MRCSSYNVFCHYLSIYDVSNGTKIRNLWAQAELCLKECRIKYEDYKNKLERLEIHKNLSEKWLSMGNILYSLFPIIFPQMSIEEAELMEESNHQKFQTLPRFLESEDKFTEDITLCLQTCLNNIKLIL